MSAAEAASPAEFPTPDALFLRAETLRKGIDNHRADVQLSPAFVYTLGETIKQVLKRAVEAKTPLPPKAEVFDSLRDSYYNMIVPLIHRTKLDLTAEQVQLLQYAIIKHILQEVRQRLNDLVAEMKASESKLRNSGSPKLLTLHQQVVWLSTNYAAILYSCNQQIFKQLQKVETGELSRARAQYLQEVLPQQEQILFNPMLWCANLAQEDMLLAHFALWGNQGQDFDRINEEWESQLANHLGAEFIVSLKDDNKVASEHTALFDELGGLLTSQTLLGIADHQTDVLSESVSWLEHPDNIELAVTPAEGPGTQRRMGWLRGRSQRRKSHALLKAMTQFLQHGDRMQQITASWFFNSVWNQVLAEHFDPVQVCSLIAGTAPRNLQKRMEDVAAKNPITAKKLQAVAKQVEELCGPRADESTVKILRTLARFRLHLKYYRFAHRAFNVLSILEKRSDVELAVSGGNLYRLFADTEGQEYERKIAHHTILKADVRGSTLVTEELANQGLNPASYFSQRFFDPINESLEQYGAEKLFIEGDAVILSLTEPEGKPQDWFSVSRASGLARELIDVIRLKNAYSKRTGLPLLEIGIGISYADHAPVFLYDAGQPIMISAAIGRADRLSSCSWKLKAVYDASVFNVEVCRIARENEEEGGEKGQNTIRYNVNGILLDEMAFAKLKTEIALKKTKIRIENKTEIIYFGQYPDVAGKHRDVVIRAGQVHLWKNDTMIVDTSENPDYFYEVVTQRSILSAVGDKLKNTAPGE